MDELITIEALTVWKLLASVLAIVLVNVLSFWVKDYFTDKAATNRRKRDVLVSHLTPLLHNAEQVASRFLEIVTGSDKKMEASIQTYRASPPTVQQLASRFHSIHSEASEFTRHESTAFRLVNLLASMQEFTVGTLEVTNHTELSEALQFVHSKIPMGLRGNIFKSKGGYAPPLSTETQERIAAQYYCDESVFPLGLNVTEFLSEIEKGIPGVHLISPVMQFLAVDPQTVKDLYASDTNLFSQPTNEQRQLLNVIHATVYLIDFIQDLGGTPQFEEYRLLLVKTLKLWSERVKRLYLYRPDDLRADSYFATYSDIAARRYKYSNKWRIVAHALSHRSDDALRRAALAHRGNKYAKTHPSKVVSASGLLIYSPASKRKYEFRIQDDLKTIYTQFADYIEREKGLLH